MQGASYSLLHRVAMKGKENNREGAFKLCNYITFLPDSALTSRPVKAIGNKAVGQAPPPT